MKSYILISLLIDCDTKSIDFCTQFLECLYLRYPQYAPEIVSFYDPINNPVVDIDSALKYFTVDDAAWIRKKSSPSRGGIHHSNADYAGAVTIKIFYNKKAIFFEFFIDLIKACNPKYAYLHLCTEKEFDQKYEERSITSDFFLGAFDKPISRDGFDNLAWLNYFSMPYMEKIDIRGLKNTGFNVENLHNGIMLKVSPNIDDVITDMKGFVELRKRAKEFFPDNFFRKAIPIY
ncbi:MAG: hypothetical protein B0W54_17500 [Cellvibrio sp. 79]|nr:MAG: hypothetical protein B0W54_17500 [Cellvibrio sp. 79]